MQITIVCFSYLLPSLKDVNTRSGRFPRTTPSGRGEYRPPPIRSQLLLKLDAGPVAQSVERWAPCGESTHPG